MRGARAFRAIAVLCGISVGAACGVSADGGAGAAESPTSVADSGTQTVIDEVAGISYEIPKEWPDPQTEDLVPFLTSAAYFEDPTGNVLVGTGEFDATFMDPSTEGLSSAAWGLAASTAEFFFPGPGSRTELVSEPREVDGVPGWHVRLRIEFRDTSAVPMLIDTLAVVGAKPAFIFVAVQRSDPPDANAFVEHILGSVKPLDGS